MLMHPSQEPELTGFTDANGVVDAEALKRILPEMPIWVKNPYYDKVRLSSSLLSSLPVASHRRLHLSRSFFIPTSLAQVDWINRLVLEMWPYIDTAASMQIKAQVTPLLASYKPAALDSISFEELSLGSLPPTVCGIKVYDTADNEMILEPVLKWAGNPNVLVAVKALGITATVQLVDLTVFLTARLTLKPLVDVFPCFSKMTASLMAKPEVDFGLKVIGGDVMAIPGLYSYVQETIREVVADLMLWPKTYELYNAAGAANPVGWLTVSEISAKGLKNTVAFGISDPYVKLSLGGVLGTRTTSVKWNNLNPDGEGEEVRMLVSDPGTQVLELSIFDQETKGKDRLMSVAAIPLDGCLPEHPKVVNLGLVKDLPKEAGVGGAPKYLGYISAKLTYQPFSEGEEVEEMEEHPQLDDAMASLPVGGGVLRVTVHSGEDLEGKSHSNPYVKVRFRQEERKTKVVKKSADCAFDEAPFVFLADAPPVDEYLHVQVWSKNLSLLAYVSAKEAVGYVDVPLCDVVANRRMNEVYQLNESRNGKVKIELEWVEKKAEKKEEEKAPLEAAQAPPSTEIEGAKGAEGAEGAEGGGVGV